MSKCKAVLDGEKIKSIRVRQKDQDFRKDEKRGKKEAKILKR